MERMKSHTLEIVTLFAGLIAAIASYCNDIQGMVGQYAPAFILAMFAAFCVGIVFGLYGAGYSKECEKTRREKLRLEHERTLAEAERSEQLERERISKEKKARDRERYLIAEIKALDYDAKEALAYIYRHDCELKKILRDAPFITPIKRWLVYETVSYDSDRLMLTDEMRLFLDEHQELIELVPEIESTDL